MRYNRLTLIGRLCADPVEKQSGAGKSYAGFNLAVDDGWGDNKETIFIHVRVYGQQAVSTTMRFLRKGSLALFDGKAKQDRWEKDGRKHERIVMHAFQVELGPKEQQAAAPSSSTREYRSPTKAETDSFIEADDTPF